MKKYAILTVLLAAAMLFSACAGASKGPTPDSAATEKAETAAQTAETESPRTPGTTEERSEPEPTTETPEPPMPSTPSPMTPEKQRDLDDRAFLATVDFPKYEAGEEGQVCYSGRWFEKEIDGVTHHVTSTDGAQIFFMTQDCTEVQIEFTVITKYETPYFAFSVDGGEMKRQMITDPTLPLPDAGRHVVRVMADSMNQNEAKWKEEIGIALRAVVPVGGGRIRAIVPQNKMIFFYGDSITEGIAVFGSNNPRGNSASLAYPWFTCKKLGAIPYYIGYSASGVSCTGSFNTFYGAVDKLSSDRQADLTVIPDLIVVNHGTNDGDGSGQSFRNDLKKALDKLVRYYPGVPIVYMIPFCGNRASDIRTVCENYENVTVVPTDGWTLAFADGLHPNRAGAKRAGDQLAAAIKEIVGKDFFNV